MRQPIRRANVVRATSPDYSYARSPSTGGQGGSHGAPASGSGSTNWLLILVVLILVPANILVIWGSGSFSSYYSEKPHDEPAAAEGRISVRHVYHRQPDEVWSVDAHEKSVKRPHEDDAEPAVPETAQANKAVDKSKFLVNAQVEEAEEDASLAESDDENDVKASLMKDEEDEESDKASTDETEEDFSEDKVVVRKDISASSSVTSQYAIGDLMPTLPVQIPGFTKSKKTFVYFRSKGCPHLCVRAKSVGWTPGVLDFTNKVFPDMLLIRWTVYGKYMHLTRTLVNQVGTGASCIGGGKGIQLLCRQQLATRNGCEFADLGIQPKQWNIQKQPQCEEFFQMASASENADKIWIMKPGGSFHGRGITLHRGDDPTLRATYGECKKRLPDGLIIQAYIMNPALMGGHKFDLRTYLLVGSTKPWLVFYHDGFARRSEKPFSMSGSNLTDPLAHITNDARQSEENHFFGFHQLEKVLVQEHGFPTDYMERVFRPRAMRVTNYLFHTAIDRTGHKIEQRTGRFQFFALDWMIDSTGASHLLEGNGDPSVKHYPGTDLTPALWESMFDLVEQIHFTPESLGPGVQVARKFKFKGWRLVYNELEAASDPYQACKINKYAKDKHPLYSYEH